MLRIFCIFAYDYKKQGKTAVAKTRLTWLDFFSFLNYKICPFARHLLCFSYWEVPLLYPGLLTLKVLSIYEEIIICVAYYQ